MSDIILNRDNLNTEQFNRNTFRKLEVYFTKANSRIFAFLGVNEKGEIMLLKQENTSNEELKELLIKIINKLKV